MSIYRNKKLLSLAKDVPHCMRCRTQNYGQVVAAHANMQMMGKGMGIKAADVPAYLCQTCHDAIDGRTSNSGMGTHEKHAEWAIAAVLSLRWALENRPEVFK